jgi:hypothetical protein
MTHRRLRATLRCLAGVAVCVGFSGATLAAQPPAPRAKPRPSSRPSAAAPATSAPAPATSIEVAVVQIAGTQAYLQPGAKGGVRRGAKVVINRTEYAVVETSDSFAVIDLGSEPLREQEKGQASILSVEQEKVKQLPEPQPLARWEHAWTSAEAPANAQTPRFVPLGDTARDRRWDVRLSVAAGGLLPLGRGGGIAQAELDARVHAEPFDTHDAFDLDASLQRWFSANLDARAGAQARPLLWLRELAFSHPMGSAYASIGRLRYAASTLGTLDGARAGGRVGQGFTIGAFGGLLPDPLSGEPSLDAERFGVEATYARPELDLRPEAALVVHGSTFRGSLDERRVSGTFGIYSGLSRLGGYFEVSNFDANNPWKAAPVELTAAGLDASIRSGVLQIGGRLDVLQPVRSRWLASFLPASWLCRTTPAAAGAAEPCDGSVSTRATASLDASVEVDNVSLTLGATTTRDITQTGGAPDTKGGFATGRVVRLAKIARVEASGSYSQATYLDMLSGWAGPGVNLLDDVLDLAVYYRGTTVRYRSLTTTLLQQGVGATVSVFPSSEVVFTLQSEATGGSDANVLFFFATAMWRPRF